jgi:hypothetical protein
VEDSSTKPYWVRTRIFQLYELKILFICSLSAPFTSLMCVNAAGRLVNHFASDKRNSVSLGNLVERTCVKIEKYVHVKSDIGVIWKMKYWTERN